MRIPLLVAAAALFILPVLASAAEPDVVFADFEGADYGAWKATGDAFGDGPAHGTLPKQMPVEGFAGKGLANSFHGGDNSKGTLVSPEFTITRRAISFLIGGGGFEGKTCLNLVVDGKVVRSATGPNTAPGGSERLDAQAWDVADLLGKTAHLEIIDDATGGWGHINVDQIVFTDTKPPGTLNNVTRTVALDQQYLLFPIKTGAKRHRLAVLVDGAVVREFDVELADNPEWWAQLDVTPWAGKTATLRVDSLPENATSLASVKTSATLWNSAEIYHEPNRGQLHFSATRGWLNDPNGMVFSQGEYHLFFQLNPYSWHDGQKHWGHAVSLDLAHWRELPVALYPHTYRDDVWSGSAVVDSVNTSGWKTGKDDLLVGAYTSTGRGECIVYSNDRGRTWAENPGNPVVKHKGRDPRLLWYAPGQHWVMCLYDEFEGKRYIAFYTSPDLKAWTFASRIEGFYECPDLFELPLDGDAKNTRWVLTAASSEYMVGHFDGQTFTPETAKLPGHRGHGFYAAQTFSNEPQGRRIQIGWFQTATPGVPFNQSMTLPHTLELRTTPEGPRLVWAPVPELEKLRGKSAQPAAFALTDGERPIDGISSDLLEVRAELTPGDAATAGLRVRGVPIRYDARKHELSVGETHAPAALHDGKLSLIIYADRTCLEVFAADGLLYMPVNLAPKPEEKSVVAFARDGTAQFSALFLYELNSIWPQQP